MVQILFSIIYYFEFFFQGLYSLKQRNDFLAILIWPHIFLCKHFSASSYIVIIILLIVIFYLKWVQDFFFLNFFFSNVLYYYSIFILSCKNFCICLFTSQKFIYHFLYIAITSWCPYFLKSFFQVVIFFHFIFHFSFEECAP